MGGAILKKLLASGFVAHENVVVGELESQVERLQKDLGVRVTADLKEATSFADVVIMAVKPHTIFSVMDVVRPVLRDQLFISIAAGVTLDTLNSTTTAHKQIRWVRVMPNVACLVGESATAYFPHPACSEEDSKTVEAIFGKCGLILPVATEPLLDASTGVAGCGIAYIFLVLEALADGGVKAGLTRAVAQQLATQTVLGAAAMQKETGTHPGPLKDMVCSPGGTTIRAVSSLEKNGLRYAMMDAVHTAFSHAQEVGKESKAKL